MDWGLWKEILVRNPLGRTGVVMAFLMAAAVPASAQEMAAQAQVEEYTVSAEKHVDEFTGGQVLVTRVKDVGGKVLNSAKVEFDPAKGTRLQVTTPSGIQVTVTETCEIRPAPVRIVQFEATRADQSTVFGGWRSVTEERPFYEYRIRVLTGDPKTPYKDLQVFEPLGAQSDYHFKFTFDSTRANTLQLVGLLSSECDPEIVLAEQEIAANIIVR